MIETPIHHFFSTNFWNKKTKLSFVSVMLPFIFLMSACSTLPPEQQNPPETEITNTVELKELGPYEKAQTINQPSVVSYAPPEDPLRFINEPIFAFNNVAYEYVLSPIASGYEKIVPQVVDTGITNFFYNLREPLYAINHFLQGNFSESGESLLRLLVNTTIGLAGLFDPANDLMTVERNKTTFGNTLQSYGVGHGAYLVLPFLGPSDFRDTASLTFNYFLHPLNYINDETAAQHLLIFDGIHSQVPVLSNYPQVLKDVDNRYEFIRNLYMQNSQRDGQAKRKEVFTTSNKEE